MIIINEQKSSKTAITWNRNHRIDEQKKKKKKTRAKRNNAKQQNN